MQRIVIFLTLSLFACVDPDDSADDSTGATTDVTERSAELDDLQRSFTAVVRKLALDWAGKGNPPTEACISGALGMSCGHCSGSLIPPVLHCWVSTPIGECSMYCDLAGLCGGGCRS